MNKITITLPLPNRILLPNRSKGLHWSKTSKVKEKARWDGKMAAIAASNESPTPFFLRSPVALLHWYSRTKIRPDRDGVISSCKSYFDGLADSGLFANDRDLRIREVEFSVDKKDPRLTIELSEA